MTNWNSVEQRLQNWKPRPPAPEVKTRLFGPPEEFSVSLPRLTDFTRWVAPALGCFLLVLASLSTQYKQQTTRYWASTNLLDSNYGNPPSTLLVAAQEHSDINSVPSKRMELTLGTQEQSVVGYRTISVSQTNQLMH